MNRKIIPLVVLNTAVAIMSFTSAQNTSTTRPYYGVGANAPYGAHGGLGFGFNFIIPTLIGVIIILLLIIVFLYYKLRKAGKNIDRRRGR